ncbi:MAG: tripartite tricarboxylate transporter TctB family protein [Rhodospirillales bacterium]|nr:tripartite tricarboxylate transporter TctB family protein [Rhodospirillales bacterium]
MSLSRILGLASALIGAGFLFLLIPAQTETISRGALSPGTFPSVAASLIIVAGLVQWLRPTGTAIFEGERMLRAVAVIAACLAATFAFEFFGYMVIAPVLVVVLMFLTGERRWFWIGIGFAVFPALIWAIFEIVLRRPLP